MSQVGGMLDPSLVTGKTRMLCGDICQPAPPGSSGSRRSSRSPPKHHTRSPQLLREEGPDWREVILREREVIICFIVSNRLRLNSTADLFNGTS